LSIISLFLTPHHVNGALVFPRAWRNSLLFKPLCACFNYPFVSEEEQNVSSGSYFWTCHRDL
jgi:hypothetical protein